MEMEMEGIEHRKIQVNGINMHVAEKGSGPVVLLIHGFPELWYSWRHQIHGLAARGYRAVAPDMRGFGDTDAPPSASSYTVLHLVGDLIALIDALGLQQVYVVAHDWGAVVAWYMCQFRPDVVKSLVALSVIFRPRVPSIKPLDMLRKLYGDDYYVCRFQRPHLYDGAQEIGPRFLFCHYPGLAQQRCLLFLHRCFCSQPLSPVDPTEEETRTYLLCTVGVAGRREEDEKEIEEAGKK